MPYLGIFRLELEVEVNELAIFEISTLEFVELGYFVPKREKKNKHSRLFYYALSFIQENL